MPSVTNRYQLLEETLEMLPLLWGKGTPEFHGELIESPGLICYPRPIQEKIPILIGGAGEKKTLRMVAEHADAANVFGDPHRVGHKVEVLRRHCADVGRDPAEIEVTHLMTALAADDRPSLRDRIEGLRDRNTTAEEYMARSNAGTVDDLADLFAGYHSAGAGHSIVAIPDVAEAGSIEAFSGLIERMA